MKWKTVIIFLSILLSKSIISYAQVENPYASFSPEELKKNKNYVKNFNPGSYDSKIFYNCMMDVINSARKQYRFSYPLLHNNKLDTVAQMQAHFQATRDEVTDQNQAPYRTTEHRLRKYGLSTNGTELVAKAKAHKGVEEYSYYDICMELIRSLLKNMKTAEVLLDKRYTYIGFGYESDQYMKSMYISIILGNDLIFNEDKPNAGTKDLPYQKGRAGLGHFDAKICQRCRDDMSLEVLSDYISVSGDDVIFTCNNLRDLRKMIGREGDAIVLDFVKHSSYECNQNIKDNDFIHRGFLSKPITYQKIVDANEEPDKKSNKVNATIAQVPNAIDINEPFDMNIIILKDNNIPCRTIFKKHIINDNWAYSERLNFMKDLTSIKNAGDWTLTQEEGIIEFNVPLPLNKTSFTKEDIALAMKNLDYPQYKIQKVEIVSYHSLDYANDQTQLNLQKKRTEAMAKVLAQKLGVSPITNISYQDNWDDFKKDVVNHHYHYDLTLIAKEAAIEQLQANQKKIAKELEAEYLQHHHYAKIIMHVTYPITTSEQEYQFVLYKFNKALEKNNMALAMSVQKYVIQKVEEGKYPISIPNRMQIPENKTNQPLLINKLYMQYWLSKEMNNKIIEDAHRIYNLDNTNNIAYFNVCVTKVNNAEFKTTADVNKLQSEVDKLYAMSQIPKDVVNSLNLELQFKIITFIKSKPSDLEYETLQTNTYTRLKNITDPQTLYWHNAYKLSHYFILNQDYKYALSLMAPFINDEDIFIDFLLCYISVAATQESAFMSNLFTKAVNRAAEKAPTGLCGLFDKLPISIFDNKEVQRTICKVCNR